MTPKIENQNPLISMKSITSTNDWLERKKMSDGAEGLWRIGDNLYDFTMWSRTHPGGKFWLDVTRGTDITEAFETHHFDGEAEKIRDQFYRRKAVTPRNSSTTFRADGFYEVFKRKIREGNLTIRSFPPWKNLFLSDCLAIGVFLTAILGGNLENSWTLISGLLLGILTIKTHDFLHTNNNWRVYYFNLSCMSCREWRIKHVLSHHQYRNTPLDLEVSTLQPFFISLSSSKTQNFVFKFLHLIQSLIQFAVTAHLEFLKRIFDVLSSRKLEFHSEELICWSLPFFLYLSSSRDFWDVFIQWNVIIMTGSFLFNFFRAASLVSPDSIISEDKSIRDKEDFGVKQLSSSETNTNFKTFAAVLTSYKNCLHYLSPATTVEKLSTLVPPFDQTCKEFGMDFKKA